MLFIYKEDVENYRYAIAKICFLRLYKDFSLVKDIKKSNSMIVREQNQKNEITIYLFSRPKDESLLTKDARIYYQKAQYTRAMKAKNNADYIYPFSSEFEAEYNEAFRMAVSDSDGFYNSLTKSEIDFLEGIILQREMFMEKDVPRYKYYRKESVETNSHNIVDGKVSFSDPNTFNDPFDVNCFFANATDISNMFRILCVAQDPKQILMWSYYSEDHKGYCFEYREKDIINSIVSIKNKGLCLIGPVDYTNARPAQHSRLNRISISEINFYIQVAFSKYIDWKHEGEYRYVLISESFATETAAGNQYIPVTIPLIQAYEGYRGPGALLSDSLGRIVPTVKLDKDPNSYRLIE